MTVSLATVREAVRVMLRDASDVGWSDAQLEQGIAAAIDEYGRQRPRQVLAELTVSGRAIDLSDTAPDGLGSADYDDLVRVVAAEYPVDLYPPSYVRFDRFGSNLTLQTDRELAAETVRLYLELTQTLTSGTSTIPEADAELLQAGAAGHALLQLATESSRSLTLSEREAERVRTLADTYLERFRRRVRDRRIRQGGLYRPAAPFLERDIVSFPE